MYVVLNCTFFFKYIVKYSSWAAPKFQWKKIRTELFSHPYLYSFLHQSDSFFGLEFVSNYFDKCWYNFLTAFSTFWPYRGNSTGSSSVDVIVLFTMLQTDSKMWHTALMWRSKYVYFKLVELDSIEKSILMLFGLM